MITGFNTNVRYRGRVYHVQTEDSGRKNPHVISHLYHGGTILSSEKRQYGDLLGVADLVSVVRRLMEEQHRSMLERLKRGEFDAVIAERLDPDEDTGGQAAAPPEAGPPPAAPPEPAPAPARAFGDGIVSQKPLDEVILEYLVDKARSRGAEAGGRTGRGPRSRE